MSVIYLKNYRSKQEKIAELRRSASRARVNLANTGAQHIDVLNDPEHLLAFWYILDFAAREPFTLKSDLARQAAFHIAVCASENLISVKIDNETYGNRWHLTAKGNDIMGAIYDQLQELVQ